MSCESVALLVFVALLAGAVATAQELGLGGRSPGTPNVATGADAALVAGPQVVSDRSREVVAAPGGPARNWGFRVAYRLTLAASNSDAVPFFAHSKQRIGHRIYAGMPYTLRR